MRVYSNPTTHRLEKEATKLGCECEIRVMEPSEEGHYFVISVDGETLKPPVSLGWTDQHAIESLKRHVWNRPEFVEIVTRESCGLRWRGRVSQDALKFPANEATTPSGNGRQKRGLHFTLWSDEL